MPSFKSDESFLEKLAIGATGTSYVFEDLACQGHHPVELERGSMGYKIWKAIKIKRVRVPDLLCVRCGHRVESRAKQTLKITMSHSTGEEERAWDNELLDDDRVALVVCARVGERPIDWAAQPPVQYIPVGALRTAKKLGHVRLSGRKGVQEGSEVQIEWPAAVADAPGVVLGLSPTSLSWLPDDGKRMRTVRLVRKSIGGFEPQVRLGERILRNQVIAAVVPISAAFPCTPLPDAVAHFAEQVRGANRSDRYAAVKALAALGETAPRDLLRARLVDPREHIYVRMEAAAGLVRLGELDALGLVEETLQGENLQFRLEAAIILGEINVPAARELLISTLLDPEQHAEIRAGAAWSLGEQQDPEALSALLRSLQELEPSIRVEAARALTKLARVANDRVQEAFGRESETGRPGVAWALSKAGNLGLDAFIVRLEGLDARQWGAWVIGTQPEAEFVVEQVERLRVHDPEVYFAATVLWKVLASWVNGLEEY